MISRARHQSVLESSNTVYLEHGGCQSVSRSGKLKYQNSKAI